MKRIFYLGWLGFNNIGDELMWEIFNDLCSEYLALSEYEIIPSNFCVDIKDTVPYDCIILGGGFLLLPEYIEILHQAMKQGKINDTTFYPIYLTPKILLGIQLNIINKKLLHWVTNSNNYFCFNTGRN